ncbi:MULTISPECIES: type III secretion system cytoplasmic ring protein SctQ [Xanthomonas]|uniref:Aldolase n=1 Tax=Xanthomonas cucurbitae TaxID=56453 RepID=A0A2S7DF57_9XANT|nr:type III secretion system cytoplasmic ring protein SctQ [Xanthomonas cucurbitae]PPU72449.1 aldolase [Xanthomonas cucurbitae]QHG88380.1 YscQ/HrcQ family type III secretion apparatus protein [Xanthomonas cucurbitae]WDM67236.1 type III secretion system cytoplasmic ring protein SctQ [Xanthomonas cucurbitae]WDM71114.1 type III secretion system cytoplasmic ring protein SctQ [Xanthomonas cucurbitae]WDM74947.1 type III secretion system cytoplasmic ring protein SctQ [Xanthomonas cucurbitae]
MRLSHHCGVRLHQRPIPQADAVRACLQLDSGNLEFCVAARDGLALVANEADGEVRVALAGLLMGEPLRSLEPLGLGEAQLLAFDRCDELSEPAGIGVTVGGIDMIAEAASPALLSALQRAVEALQMPVSGWPGSLRIPTSLCIGQRSASAGMLQSLRAGDVLLHCLASSPLRAGELLWGAPGSGSMRAAVRLTPQQMILETCPTMHDDLPPPNAAQPASDLSSLELPVRLEVDQLALSLSELSALQPGQILELSVPLDQADIRLVVYGQTVGIGRLLAVGEHLGLQILSMSETPRADA